MNLSNEDKQLLDELCTQNGVNRDKVLKLLRIVYDYGFKERRTGVYDALREILKPMFRTQGVKSNDSNYLPLVFLRLHTLEHSLLRAYGNLRQ